MTLLEKIKVEAVEGSSSLTSLLRRCLLLAAKLNNADFTKWVSSELNGYSNEDGLPAYRRLSADSIGTFVGFGGRQMTNVPIPTCNLPEQIEQYLSSAPFIQSVGSIESLLRDTENGQISARWPANIIAAYQGKFYKDFSLIEAHRVIGRSAVAAIPDIVRNRIIEFVLELEKRFPAKTFEENDVSIEPRQVQSVVNNYIYGDGNRIASNCDSVDQSVLLSLAQGNWAMLESTLKELKLSAQDIESLKKSLQADPPQSKDNLGTSVSGWLGKIVGKIATGTYDLSVGTASGVIATAICRYCGF